MNDGPPAPPPIPERIVRPRKPNAGGINLVVVHLDRGVAYLERTNESLPLDDWIDRLEHDTHPGLVACQHAGRLLERVHMRWFNHRRWQFKIAPMEETIHDGDGGEHTTIRTLISFFGFAGKVEGVRHERNRYWHLLDPLQFGRATLPELALDGEDELATIYRWASDVRDFCAANGLKPCPTRGGIAKQLLRDPRFYPEPRRKVPRATNDRARDRLPGNHYELDAEPSRLYTALYLDQESSHHTIARQIDLPCANGLRAVGHFHSLADIPYAMPGSRRYRDLTAEHGLLFVKLKVENHSPTRWVPEWLRSGVHLTYLFTNELRLLKRFHARILYVIAAWVSPDRDHGLGRYAEWAREQLRAASEPVRRWLKPTLLTPYGMLATRPRAPTSAWWRAKNSTPTMLPVGRTMLAVQTRTATHDGEPSTNNVIQRGMIEAETRARSLELAHDLEGLQLRVLCVYADGVLIEPGPLPLTPPHWAVKKTLTLLRFLDETRFASREMVRLPGIRRDAPGREKAGRPDHRATQETRVGRPAPKHGIIREVQETPTRPLEVTA